MTALQLCTRPPKLLDEIPSRRLIPISHTIMKTSRNGTPLPSSSVKGKGFTIFCDEVSGPQKQKERKSVKTGKRRGLTPLQQSVVGENVLARREIDDYGTKGHCGEKGHAKISEYLNKPQLEVKDELSGQLNKNAVANDTAASTLVDDALSLMKSTEEVGESYWKTIAEDRRLALEETLEENDRLYSDIDKLQSELEESKRYLSELESYKMLYLSMCEEKELTFGKCCAGSVA